MVICSSRGEHGNVRNRRSPAARAGRASLPHAPDPARRRGYRLRLHLVKAARPFWNGRFGIATLPSRTRRARSVASTGCRNRRSASVVPPRPPKARLCAGCVLLSWTGNYGQPPVATAQTTGNILLRHGQQIAIGQYIEPILSALETVEFEADRIVGQSASVPHSR